MRGLRQAVAFLTRVPMGDVGGVDRAVPWFPIVGSLVGLAVAGVYAVLYAWVPSLVSAVVATGTGVLLTGALHEDGLADSFDALGSGATGEEAHRIMQDSRLGAYGTLALVFSSLWRIFAVASLTRPEALAGLVMAHTLGRTGAVSLMARAPAASAVGLGSSGIAAVSRRGAWFAILSGLGLSLLVAGWWVGPAAILVVSTVVALRRIGITRFGGITGDMLGACEQLGEMGVLVVVASAAWGGWDPWWI